jgi:hypothetical protein
MLFLSVEFDVNGPFVIVTGVARLTINLASLGDLVE